MYNYHKIKSECIKSGAALPVDINAHPEQCAAGYKLPELLLQMKEWREKKLFGLIQGICKHPSGVPYIAFEAEYDYGMCPTFFQTELFGNVVCKRSIFNENLTMKKEIKNSTPQGETNG